MGRIGGREESPVPSFVVAIVRNVSYVSINLV